MSYRYTKSLLLTQEDNASNADRNRKRILDIIGKEYAVIVDSRGDCKTPTAKKGLVVQEADALSTLYTEGMCVFLFIALRLMQNPTG